MWTLVEHGKAYHARTLNCEFTLEMMLKRSTAQPVRELHAAAQGADAAPFELGRGSNILALGAAVKVTSYRWGHASHVSVYATPAERIVLDSIETAEEECDSNCLRKKPVFRRLPSFARMFSCSSVLQCLAQA